MLKIQKYFNEKIIKYQEIKGHFNKNFKVWTKNSKYHLKVFNKKKYKIKKWIDGSTIKQWNETNIMLVSKKLMYIHTLKFDWKKMNYKIDEIKDQKYNNLLNKYANDKLVCCHNDLNKDNIVINNQQVFLIDFEFKRVNHKYWDIANIINEDNLNEKHINWFLKYYQGLKTEKLKDFLYINKVFCDFWKNKNWK